MIVGSPSLETLFEQLGLDSSEEAIETFIHTHQLPENVKLGDAPFWTSGQSQLLKEKWHGDDEWAPIIDQLNTELHSDSMPKT